MSADPDTESPVSGHTCDLSDTDTLETNLTSLLDFATENSMDKVDQIVFTAGDSFALNDAALATITPEMIDKAGTVLVKDTVTK